MSDLVAGESDGRLAHLDQTLVVGTESVTGRSELREVADQPSRGAFEPYRIAGRHVATVGDRRSDLEDPLASGCVRSSCR